MAAVLTHNAYGKSDVRLTKVTRHGARNDVKELSVAVQLEGDFAAAYTQGDNSRLIATDSMKNAVYVLAKDHPLTDIETFGQALGRHFMESYSHIARATIDLEMKAWERITVNGEEHPHAFMGGRTEKRTCRVMLSPSGERIESGLTDLLLLKTTDSSFAGFIRDRYTTLPETDDRIFATMLTARWRYGMPAVEWDECHQLIRRTLLEMFADHESLSVQHTLHAMGSAALEACAQIDEINLEMPNQHRVLVNLEPFGLTNRNEIFVPTDEPFGLIRGTLSRR
jgi:urate oxidase